MKQLVRSVTVKALANPICGALMKPLWNGSASVFMLHRKFHPEFAPDGTTVPQIVASVNALRQAGAKLVSLRRLVDGATAGNPPDPGSVAFTIDDGYADQAELAQEFIRLQCPVTIFLMTGFIDKTLWSWDEKVAYCVLISHRSALQFPGINTTLSLRTTADRWRAIDQLQTHLKSMPWCEAEEQLTSLFRVTGVSPPLEPPEHSSPLSWDQIRSLEATGVDFAPHSVTHRIASKLDEQESRWEIETSWNRLRAELKRPLPVYAWPTGRSADFCPRDVALAQSIDLQGAVATNDGYADFSGVEESRDRLFQLNRFAFAQQVDVNLQYGTAIELLKNRARRLVT